MDLKIGHHCEYSSCKQLDFLPFKCEYCNNYFCKNHAFPNDHECLPYYDFLNSYVIDGKIPNKQFHKNCSKPSCKISGISNINTCLKCGNNYCLDHRFPELHHCFTQDVKDGKNKKVKCNLM